MFGMQDFQKLLVWQRASALSLRIDVLLRQFPRREYVSLRAQLGRAVDSIPANIVEGCGAATQREFARYLDIAIKSASETHHHLLAAADRKLIAPDDCTSVVDEVTQVRRMLYGLRQKVLLNLHVKKLQTD